MTGAQANLVVTLNVHVLLAVGNVLLQLFVMTIFASLVTLVMATIMHSTLMNSKLFHLASFASSIVYYLCRNYWIKIMMSVTLRCKKKQN